MTAAVGDGDECSVSVTFETWQAEMSVLWSRFEAAALVGEPRATPVVLTSYSLEDWTRAMIDAWSVHRNDVLSVEALAAIAAHITVDLSPFGLAGSWNVGALPPRDGDAFFVRRSAVLAARGYAANGSVYRCRVFDSLAAGVAAHVESLLARDFNSGLQWALSGRPKLFAMQLRATRRTSVPMSRAASFHDAMIAHHADLFRALLPPSIEGPRTLRSLRPPTLHASGGTDARKEPA